MNIDFKFTDTHTSGADTAVFAVFQDSRLSSSAERFDKESDGLISDTLSRQKKFTGKAQQILSINAPKDSAYRHFVLVGMGEADKLCALCYENTGGNLFPILKSQDAESAALFIDDESTREKIKTGAAAAHMAAGITLRSYSFDKYKKNDDDNSLSLSDIIGVTGSKDSAKEAEKDFVNLKASAEGTFWARDLMNEPPNFLYPESFAQKIKDEMKPLGVKVEIIDHKKMEKLGMGAAYAVGKGSERPPCMVIMHWDGAGKKGTEAPIAFVGKGITFDTGGISIKPSAGMDEMKMDMGGAAAVCGLMKALAARKAKANVISIVALAENMPSHNAYRPGDVIASLSGQTIEVLNTDAEGRLVLADALTYIQNTYDPEFVIDLATLTGAIIVALGMEYSGAFVNDDDMWSQIESASKSTGEKLWRMPLDEAYRKQMDGNIADLNNLGNEGRFGGSCTAAAFLERFIDEDRKWAHLDIAGTMAWKKDKPTVPKGPVGFGVRVLNKLVADHYEQK
jgi:leucyl aminopeptidase